MKTIEKTSYILCAVFFVLLITACGRSQPQPTATQPEATSTNILPTAPVAATAAQPTAPVTPVSQPTATASLLNAADANIPLAPKAIGQKPALQEEAGLNTDFEVSFDQPMDQAATGGAWQVIDPQGKTVKGTVSWPTTRTLRFSPSQPLEPAAEYHATLLVKASSTAGVKITDPLSFTFDTIGEMQVSQVSPADRSTEVDNKALITIIFNRPVVPLGMAEDQSKLPQPLVITPTVQGKGEWLNTSVYVFHPETALAGATTYTASVKAGLADADGLKLAQDYQWQFTTMAPSIDSINLPDLVFAPPEGFVNVPLDQTFRDNLPPANGAQQHSGSFHNYTGLKRPGGAGQFYLDG